MGFGTSAMMNLHGNARLSPKLGDSSGDPYVAIVVPYAAASSYGGLCRSLRSCDRGYTQTSGIVSIKKLVPVSLACRV